MRKILEAQARARSARHQALSPKAARAPRKTKLAGFEEQAKELLERYPEITAQRILEELRERGFGGGYTAVKVYVRRTRPRPKPEPSLPTPSYGPGEMAQSDWSPHRVDFTHAPRQVVQVFGYALWFSRRKSYLLYEQSDFYALIDAHVKTFDRFKGAAHACTYDSQKAVVLGWEGNQPIFNPRFLAFSTHYEQRPVAARRRHPNDKPTVERSFWEFEESFLSGRRFRDLEDMRRQLAHWQDTICDQRRHKKLRRTALEMFAEEAPFLRPLPSHPYDTARVIYRVCSIDGFVSWDGNRYAVPYDRITEILPVRVTQRELFVYAADLRCVARHELAKRSAGVDVDPQNIHPPWNRHGASLEQLEHAFSEMGDDAKSFYQGLAVAAPRLCGYHARQILLLRERYSTTDLEAALRHARSFGAFDHQAVARILATRARPRTLAEYISEHAAQHLDEAAATGTAPRDLSEYDALPVASTNTAKEEDTSCASPEPQTQAHQTKPTSPNDSEDTSRSSD